MKNATNAEKILVVTLWVLCIGLVIFTIVGVVKQFNDCADAGGVLLHGTCVQKEVLINE